MYVGTVHSPTQKEGKTKSSKQTNKLTQWMHFLRFGLKNLDIGTIQASRLKLLNIVSCKKTTDVPLSSLSRAFSRIIKVHCQLTACSLPGQIKAWKKWLWDEKICQHTVKDVDKWRWCVIFSLEPLFHVGAWSLFASNPFKKSTSLAEI